MASNIDTLKEELELTRNLVNETKDLMNLKNNVGLINLTKAQLSIERKILKERQSQNKINKDEYDLQDKILSKQTRILNTIKNGKDPSEKMLKNLLLAKRELEDYNNKIKTSGAEAHNLNTILNKFGFGRLISGATELMETFKAHPVLAALGLAEYLVVKIFNSIR